VTPTSIVLHKKSRQLELGYADGEQVLLNAEYLRVFSPSAEVRGHHPSQAVLQHGKKNVAIEAISAVGNYAIQLTFDDGHDSGIYSWQYLRDLADNRETLWHEYLEQLATQGKHRDPEVQVVSLFDPGPPSKH